MTEEGKITVCTPISRRTKLAPDEPPPGMPAAAGSFRFEPASVNLARRPDSLENKTVYLVDIGFGGGETFMLEVQHWFASHMPSVKTVFRRKPGQVFFDDSKELWEEIKEKGDAVVLGVAG